MPKALTDQDINAFQDQLCDVAERLFAEHGPEAVTMRQLATELNISPMTPYRYFKDKDAILAAVRARAFNRHAEAIERAYEDSPGDLLARTSAAGLAYVRFAFEHQAAYVMMFDTNQPREADYPELVAAGNRSRATMTRHLRDLIAAGQWSGDPELVGHMYWAAMHGPIMLHLSGKLMGGVEATRIIAGLVGVLNDRFFVPKHHP